MIKLVSKTREKNNFVLETGRLVCEPLTSKHSSKFYVDWMNDPVVIKFMLSGGNYTIDLLNEYLLKIENKNIYAWAIKLKASKKHIGNIKVDPINYEHLFGEFGIMIGDKNEWGKGYAMEASQAIINFCFINLRLRKINLGLFSKHDKAFNLYKKIGFNIEKINKNYFKTENGCYDLIRMTLNKRQFNNSFLKN